jgi:hypothetical protein
MTVIRLSSFKVAAMMCCAVIFSQRLAFGEEMAANPKPLASATETAAKKTGEANESPKPMTQVSKSTSIAANSAVQQDVTKSWGSNSCPDCCDFQDCCKCCDCGPPGDYWLRAEYVNWFTNGGHAPALVATSPNGTLPSTETLYGDADYNGGYRPGLDLEVGAWLDCCHIDAITYDFLYAGRRSSPFFATSDGDPILTRPFTDANTGEPADELVAFPGVVVGSISVDNHNSLWGTGVDWRHNLCCCCECCDCCESSCCFHPQNCHRLDFVAGFRFYGFDDNLTIRENLISIQQPSPIPVGTHIDVTDSFITKNNFYGGEIGLVGQRYHCRWMYEWSAKVALGDTQQLVDIDGFTVVSFPGQPTAVNRGGLLALSSNIGHYERDQFTAIPELAFRLGYRVTDRLTLMAGYTFMYLGRVARAGDQIDTTVNPNLIPPPIGGGPNRPAFSFHESDLFLHGITLGAEYSF